MNCLWLRRIGSIISSPCRPCRGCCRQGGSRRAARTAWAIRCGGLIAITIRLHHSSHDTIVRDLQSQLTVHAMVGGQGATDLRDQSPEQPQQIILRITDDLEMVASRRAVAKLEGVESDPRSEQVGAKVKFVDLPHAVGETHRFELSIFESHQPGCPGHFSVEALAAEPSVSALNGAVVDDVVARSGDNRRNGLVGFA